MLYIIIIILIIVLCIKFKVKIKLKSFFKKGFLPRRGNFGLYCYCGKQGRGKTYSLAEYIYDNKNKCIYLCNIADITSTDYFLFNGFKELIYLKYVIDYPYKDERLLKYCCDLFSETRGEHLYNLLTDFYIHKKQLVFVYDEIFTELKKGDKLSNEVMDFLCQMRKRGIIFLTTAQEWAELPITWRRFCRYEIDCHMYNLGVVGILLKNFKDAENMKWSNDDQDFIAPLVSNTITKCRKNIANSYDTNLRIISKPNNGGGSSNQQK